MADSSGVKPEPAHTPWSATSVVLSAATPTVRNRLRTFALSITRDPGAAESLVDDAILRCAERLDLERVQPSKVVAYLNVILRNLTMSWCRRNRLHKRYLTSCDRNLVVSSDAGSALISEETLKFFSDFVAREVPVPYRDVVTLRADGLTFGEISAKLGVPVGTVMSRLFRARGYLWRWFRYLKAE